MLLPFYVKSRWWESDAIECVNHSASTAASNRPCTFSQALNSTILIHNIDTWKSYDGRREILRRKISSQSTRISRKKGFPAWNVIVAIARGGIAEETRKKISKWLNFVMLEDSLQSEDEEAEKPRKGFDNVDGSMAFSKFQQTMSDGCQHSGLRCDAILLCNTFPDLGRARGEEKLPHGNSRKLINACRIAIRMQLSGAGKRSRSLEMRGKLDEKQLRFSFAHTSWPEPTINRRRARKSNSGENYYLISIHKQSAINIRIPHAIDIRAETYFCWQWAGICWQWAGICRRVAMNEQINPQRDNFFPRQQQEVNQKSLFFVFMPPSSRSHSIESSSESGAGNGKQKLLIVPSDCMSLSLIWHIDSHWKNL